MVKPLPFNPDPLIGYEVRGWENVSTFFSWGIILSKMFSIKFDIVGNMTFLGWLFVRYTCC